MGPNYIVRDLFFRRILTSCVRLYCLDPPCGLTWRDVNPPPAPRAHWLDRVIRLLLFFQTNYFDDNIKIK